MEIKTRIENLIKEALKKLEINSEAYFSVEHPADLKMGDYSTNVAMVYAKNLKMNPKDLAEKIVNQIKNPQAPLSGGQDSSLIREDTGGFIQEIQIAGAGFINFYLSKEYFYKKLNNILELGSNYGRNNIHKNKKILIEHSSPNLFKPFHIGHVMNNTIGESITRFARFSGAEVVEISYPSDVSFGIGKAVWALLEDGLEVLNNLPNEASQLAYLGDCYVKGNKALVEDPSLETRMREITKLIYDQTPSKELEAYNIGKKINLEYFKMMTKKLGSLFDAFIFESEAGKEGEKLVRENTPNIFTESEGATIYKGEQDGLHTRVFINKEGYPTYEAKDVGLLFLKFSRYNPDLSIFITDHEQSEYFKVVVSAAGKINKEWKEKTIHRTHGRMSFKGQKMSSRLGGVPLASDLIEVLLAEIEELKKNKEEVDIKEDREAVAISALKFAILKSVAGKNINFDPETSLSFEGDSGPYLQYSTVRANSVLEKVSNVQSDFSIKNEITEVEKYLDRFEEVVAKCINVWEPHHMVDYLLDLAQRFNSWYAKVKIIDETNKDMAYNLAIVKAFHSTMQNGLYLLGIESPEKM